RERLLELRQLGKRRLRRVRRRRLGEAFELRRRPGDALLEAGRFSRRSLRLFVTRAGSGRSEEEGEDEETANDEKAAHGRVVEKKPEIREGMVPQGAGRAGGGLGWRIEYRQENRSCHYATTFRDMPRHSTWR